MICPCCNGTGGSMGNKDPNDDWICKCCGGSGVIPDSEGDNDENDEEDK